MLSPLDSSAPSAVRWIERQARWFAPAVFALAVLVVFRSALWSTTQIFSCVEGDITAQFVPWRAVGFGELAHGHFMLWNPYVYGGAPYFGGFQSALLYPLNWHYLFLPLILAINLGMAIHVYLAGFFTYVWCRGNGVSVLAGTVGGLAFMLCGPFFLRNYAGHLPHTCVMAWTPLLLWCVDRLFSDGRSRWTLLGAAIVLLQILAGHPQYVYYSALGVGVYSLVKATGSPRWKAALTRLAILYVVGAALAAVQLGAGLEATSESLRAGGGSERAHYLFAAMFSLAPADLVTLIAPYFSCAGTTASPVMIDGYWGTKYVWESSIFIGIVPVMLASLALLVPDRKRLTAVIVMGLAALVVSLGDHTPLFQWLYKLLPGFSSFRGTCKFTFLLMLAISLAAAVGLDAIIANPRRAKSLAVAGLICSAVLFGLSQGIAASSKNADGVWARAIFSNAETEQAEQNLFLLAPEELQSPAMISQTGDWASASMANAAGVFLALAAVMAIVWWRPALSPAIAVAAFMELTAVAIGGSITTPLTIPHARPDWLAAINDLPADQRILVAANGTDNLPMDFFRSDIWGYDPMVMRRWAEFIFALQNLNPASAIQYCDWLQLNQKMLQMIRCRYLFFEREQHPIVQLNDLLPVASLVGQYRVEVDRDATFAAIRNDEFDPKRTVILEQAPTPNARPVGTDRPGNVQVLASTTDSLELEANLNAPAVLLITNAYSRGWKATSIGPSPQDHYDVVPADWALQGVPLAAGKHHLLLRYRPAGFVIGLWISAVSAIGYAIAVGWCWKRSRLDSNQRPSD